MKKWAQLVSRGVVRWSTRVAIVGTVAAASIATAQPLPPEFGSGNQPPDDPSEKAEIAVGLALSKYASAVSKCYATGVKLQFNGRPNKVVDCLAKVNDILANKTIPKLNKPPTQVVPGCLDVAATALVVKDQVDYFSAVLSCDGVDPLPAEFGAFGGAVPPSKPVLEGEAAVAKALLKLQFGLTKCYTKGVKNLRDAKPHGVTECITDVKRGVRTKYDEAITKIPKPGVREIPLCLDPANVANSLEPTVQFFNGVVFCAM